MFTPLAEQQRIIAEIKKWFTLIDQIEQDKADLQTTIELTKSKILDLPFTESSYRKIRMTSQPLNC